MFIAIPIAAGYIAGAFTPAIGRKIKSFFVKKADVVKADATKAESAVVADATAVVAAVEKKV